MGSQGPSSSSNQQQSPPAVPAWLRPYYKQTVQDFLSGMGNLPGITSLYQNTPLLNTPNLTGQQTSDINQFQGAVGNNLNENMSAQGLQNFIGGGPGTPSAATNAEINEFNTLQAPQIESQAALSGLGNSGAALSALSQGQESALVPFLQQDQANQLTAAGNLGQLGLGEASQQQTQLTNALQAAGLPYQVAQQQAQDLYNQQQQQWQFAQGIQTGGQSQFPSLIGGGTSSGNTSSSQPKF